jgi:hypothetical protein
VTRLPARTELKKLANDLLTLALGLDVHEITDFAAISESDAPEAKEDWACRNTS